MKTSMMFQGLVAVGMLGLAACSGGSEATDTGAGAASGSAGIVLVSGHYRRADKPGVLDVVVRNGVVSGHYSSSTGDLAHGGATCEFTFAGKISGSGTQTASLTVVDGYDTVTGTLTAKTASGSDPTKASLVLKLSDTPNACWRTSPVLAEASGLEMTGTKAMEAGVLGYRSISAEKAYFHDTAGGAARRSYVVKGDTVITTADEADGFVKVKYVGASSSTTGYVQASDLAPTSAAPATAAAIAAGKYINAANGAVLLVYGPCSEDNSLSTNDGTSLASGTLGDDKHTIAAPEGDVCGAYTLTQTETGVVKVSWKQDPTAHLGADVEAGCLGAEGTFEMTVPGTTQACK